MEGVHEENFNQMTLHTAPGCVPSTGGGGQSGYCIGNGDCGQDGGFVGCGVRSTNPTSFGTPFNANGGGVYAMLWTSSGIKVWYFAAKDVPGDIRSGNPNPNSWPQPQANFGGCDFNQYFRDMKIVSIMSGGYSFWRGGADHETDLQYYVLWRLGWCCLGTDCLRAD
jgi:hypothetical protein